MQADIQFSPDVRPGMKSARGYRREATYRRQIGEFEIASLQFNFTDIPRPEAEAFMRLVGDRVLPRLM